VLNALFAFVRKEQYRNGFRTKRRIFFDCLCDCRAPVLPVIDNEVGFLQIHFQKAKPIGVDRFETDFALV
jgi:hypothetical protein